MPHGETEGTFPFFSAGEIEELAGTYGIPATLLSAYRKMEEELAPQTRENYARVVHESIRSLQTETREGVKARLLMQMDSCALFHIHSAEQERVAVAEEMPMIEIGLEEGRTIASEVLYGAIRQKTGREHKKVNDLEGHDDEVMCTVDCMFDSDAQRHGSHGALRTPRYVKAILDGVLNPHGVVKIRKEFPGKIWCTGGMTFGQVCTQMALQFALEQMRTGKIGICSVAGRRAQHAGRLERIAREATRQGLNCLLMFNTQSAWYRVRPEPDGLEVYIGTEPICFGVSLGKGRDGFVSDFASTEWSEGKMRAAYESRSRVPLGVLRRKDGSLTTNPGELYEGEAMLSPLGASSKYKGMALGMGIKLYVDASSGRHYAEVPEKEGNNFSFIFEEASSGSFSAIRSTLDQIRSIPTASGAPVRIPGEHGIAGFRKAQKTGRVLVPEKSWEEITKLHRELAH